MTIEWSLHSVVICAEVCGGGAPHHASRALWGDLYRGPLEALATEAGRSDVKSHWQCLPALFDIASVQAAREQSYRVYKNPLAGWDKNGSWALAGLLPRSLRRRCIERARFGWR